MVSAGSAAEIDCKVILCLAGSFPGGCEDAHSYMIDRITDIPPKPPYGACETVGLNGEQEVYNGARSRMFTESEPPVCRETRTYTREDAGTECTLWSTTHHATIAIAVERGGDEPAFTNSYVWRSWETLTAVDPAANAGR